MGRAILPELVIAVVALGITAVVLVGIGVAQWAAGVAVVGRIREGRRRRVLEREARARRAARWEARTDYRGGGWVSVTVVRVARWDGREVIIDRADSPVVFPEERFAEISRAQIDAELRADMLNTQITEE